MDQKIERLEAVRSALRINKSELARRIGSPQSHVSKILSGEREIGPVVSGRIVQELGLNPMWWESGEGEMFTQSNLSGTKAAGAAFALGGSGAAFHLAQLDSMQKRIRELEEDKAFLQEQVKSLNETIRLLQVAMSQGK